MLADRSHYYVITSNEISIIGTYYDKNYGSWAKGAVIVPNFNRYFDNVFISPLAYKNIKEKNDDGCLILVRLIKAYENCTFTGVFYGEFKTGVIINSSYDDIITEENGGIADAIRGEFWKTLFSDEEYKKFNAYCGALQMGLISSDTYELPNDIAKKLSR